MSNSTNVVAFANANLPSVSNLATALRNIVNEVGPSGVVLLKMDKTGHWVYGGDQTEVEEGSTWAVNPYSFAHGFIAWGAGEVLGEKMVFIAEPLPETGPAPEGAKKGWEPQFSVGLKCLTGEDAGLEVRFSATSTGGKRAVQALAEAIAQQSEKDKDNIAPVVTLDKDHYTHREYGRIYTPIFNVKSWMSAVGGPAAEPEPAAAEPTAAAPARRRRQAAE